MSSDLVPSSALYIKNLVFQCFRELAVEAEANVERVPPPLFLRFVNLLVNDAIFLLDESLSNMSKLRELQTSR